MRNHKKFILKNLESQLIDIKNDNHLRNSYNHITNIIKTSIFDYTDLGYEKINTDLRNNINVKSEYFLKYGLNKMKSFKGVTYRSAYLDNQVIKLYWISFNQKKPICDLAFFSSSKNFAIASNDFSGNVIFKIESKNGKSIMEISKHKYEEEILFTSKTKFQITEMLYDHFLRIHNITLIEI